MFIRKKNNRIKWILSIYIILFLGLSYKLIKLQVYPTENVINQYENHQSENISDSKLLLLDKNNKDLLSYNKKYILVIDKKPFSLNNYENTLEDLMAFNFIMKGEYSDFNYTDVLKSTGKLYYNITEETYNKVKKLINLKGIYSYERNESQNKNTGDISAFLSDMQDTDNLVADSMQWKIYNYVKDNEIPVRNFYLDNNDVYSKEENFQNATNKKIKLTIDEDIQDQIREVLNNEEFKELNNIGVCLLESDTGAIRAMVQKDETKANINLCIEGSGYEPGSIFKLITLGSALENGIVSSNDKFTCSGKICKTVHGTLTVDSAFEKSCNDIFAQIGNKVTYESIMEYSQKLGLFKRSLEIQGETIGIKPKESDGMNNISIGQCITVSPIQMLGATNAIINGGVYVKPYLIQSILDNDDNEISNFNSEKVKVFSKTTSSILKENMKKVVLKGTGTRAKVDGIEIGGKTGSATSGSENKTHAWFSGYFVNNKKNYTVIVFVPDIEGKGENGEDLGGGNTAAPIFSEVVKKITEKQ